MTARTFPTTTRIGFAAPPVSGWAGWVARFWRAHETRRQLAELDPRLLRDIGVTQSEARREADRAPWDV